GILSFAFACGIFGSIAQAQAQAPDAMFPIQDSMLQPWTVLTGTALLILVVGLLLHNKRLRFRLDEKNRQLHEQQQRLILLTENRGDWVWTTDNKYRFTYVSPSIKKLLGYEAEDILGCSWEKILHPGESDRAYALDAHITAAARRGEISGHKDVTVDT